MKIRLLFLALAAVVVGTFFIFERPVSTIGSWKIYQKDIEYRDKVIKQAFPNNDRSLGLAQLEKGAHYLQVLEKNGVTLTPEEIETEARRIDHDTKDPASLAAIKKIFGEDRKAYLKDYVLPLLSERVLQHEFFPSYEQAHTLSLERARNLIREAQTDPEKFIDLMRKENVPLSTVTLSLKEGLKWARENSHLPPNEAKLIDLSSKPKGDVYQRVQTEMKKRQVQQAQVWYDNFVHAMKDGEIFHLPINQDSELLIIRRLHENKNGDIVLQIATIPKTDFETWYHQQLEELKAEH